ncbi:MAG: hypothetical protein IPK57_07590 [Chitinophagaceae bacterium]|nr:hypothetical protein [Chitinophagaceae bacterium]
MKKSILILLSLAVLCVAVFLSACSKDDVQEPDPVAGLTKIIEGYAAGAATKVEVYTKEASINAGYTNFILRCMILYQGTGLKMLTYNLLL